MHMIFIFGSLNLGFHIKLQLALGKLIFSGLQKEKSVGQMPMSLYSFDQLAQLCSCQLIRVSRTTKKTRKTPLTLLFSSV